MNAKKLVLQLCLWALPSIAMANPATPAAEAGSGVRGTSLSGYFSRGIELFNAKNYVGAEHQLSYVVKHGTDNPERCEALYFLALSAYERGDVQCAPLLEEFISQYPTSPHTANARVTLGDHYFYHGKFGEALVAYSHVNSNTFDDDRDEDVAYRRAFANLRLANYSAAEAEFKRLSSTKRYSQAASFYQAYIDYTKKNYDSALKRFSAISAPAELAENAKYYICQINFKNKKFDEVRTEGKRLLQKNPESFFTAELNRIVGESAFHLGDYRDAEPFLKRYVALTEAQGATLRSAQYALGVVEYNNAEYSESLKTFEKVIDGNDPIAQSGYLFMGQAYRATAEPGAASLAFEKAMTLDYDRNTTEAAFYNYAVAQSTGGRTPFSKSIDLFENFLNKYPTSRYADNVNEYLLNAYMTSNDYSKALSSISKIKNPNQKVLRAKQHVLYQLGVQSLSNSKVKEASKYLSQSLELASYDKALATETHLWMGECLYREGKYSEAASHQSQFLKSASKQNSNIDIAHYGLGYSLFKQRHYGDATAHFKTASTSKRLSAATRADAFNRLGDIKFFSRNYSEASTLYDKAVEINSKTGDYALFQKGVMQGYAKEYAKEISLLDEMMKRYPESTLVPQALLEKATAQDLMGNHPDATRTYESVASRYPQSPEARKALLAIAVAERNDGNEAECITAYKRVISTYPTSDEAQVAAYDLKLIYADNGTLSQLGTFLRGVPNAPSLNVDEVDRLSFEAAEKAITTGKTGGLEKMKNYLQEFPSGEFVANANYYIARHLHKNGNIDEALVFVNQALTKQDASFAEDALAIKSDILTRQGKSEDALAVYETMLSKASTDEKRVIALLGMMRVARNTEHWTNAKNSADALLNLGNLSANEELEATLCRAIANDKLGDTSAAQADFKKLASDPANEYGAQGAYLLALSHYNNKEYTDAEMALNNFIDAGTPHQYWMAKAFILLADVYHKEGKDFEAREYLQSLKNNYPGSEQDIIDDINSRLSEWKSKKK